jgi:hypothetical protein
MKILFFLLFFLLSLAQANQKIEIRGINDTQKTKEIEAKLTKVQEEHDLFGLTELLSTYRLKPNLQLSSDSVMIYEVQSYSELYNAVIDDDVSKVKEILQSSDLDIDRVYHGKYTALITASYHGQDKIVKLLLENGVDIDKRVGEYHENALYHAIWEQHLSTIKLLVEAGADLERLTGIAKSTPLMHAARGKSAEIVKYLLDKGANPNALTKDGYTPLMYALLEPAMKKGNEEIVALLSEKSDLNYKTKILSKLGVPQTALLIAIMMNRSQKVIDNLFSHGAKIGESAKEKVAFLKAYQQKCVTLYRQKKIQKYKEATLRSISYVGYSSDKQVQVELSIAISALYEFCIIEGNKLDKKQKKLFKKLANENIKVAAYHDMFRILEDAKYSDQSHALKMWQKKYKKSMPNWCFKELKKWAKSLDENVKKRILSCIKVFESEVC